MSHVIEKLGMVIKQEHCTSEDWGHIGRERHYKVKKKKAV